MGADTGLRNPWDPVEFGPVVCRFQGEAVYDWVRTADGYTHHYVGIVPPGCKATMAPGESLAYPGVIYRAERAA